MVSTNTTRTAFVQSLIQFMIKYDFQGVDLNWYYPSQTAYGGHAGDAENLVLLVQGMRKAFCGMFGLSVMPPHDYYDLYPIPAKERTYCIWSLYSYYGARAFPSSGLPPRVLM